MLGADHIGGRDTYVVEEHFVELVRTRHLHEWSHVDAGRAHVDHEVRDPQPLKHVDGVTEQVRLFHATSSGRLQP